MNLFDQISEDIKSAMLARDKVTLEALRGIKKEFLEAKTAKGSNGELPDDKALAIIRKLLKQRRDSAEIYTQNDRPELAEAELAESLVLERYLPKQLRAHAHSASCCPGERHYRPQARRSPGRYPLQATSRESGWQTHRRGCKKGTSF